MKFRAFTIVFLFSLQAYAQDTVMDSLKSLLSSSREDTNKVWLLNELSWELLNNGDYEVALVYAEQGKRLAEKLNFSAGVSSSMNKMGLIYFNRGDFSKALEQHLLSLAIREKTGDLLGTGSSYNNIGNIFNRQGDYRKALEYYDKCLKIKERLGDKKGIANALNNIGSLYNNMHEYDKALEYYMRAVDIAGEIGNRSGIADLHNNIGTLFSDLGQFANAMEQHKLSIAIRREMGDKEGIAASCINMADITLRQALAEKDAGLKAKKLAETRTYLNEALAVSTEIDAKDDLMDTYGLLASLDSAQGNWKDAYFYHTKFVLWRDSMDNEENVKKMVQAEMNFEFNKKEAITKAEQDKKDAIAAEEARKQMIITWFIVFGLVFALLFALLIYRSYRQNRAAAKIIAEKNVELERLSLAASETHNVVIILSPDGKVEWANESFTRLNGISIEELKRLKGETIYDISNYPNIRQAVEDAVSGKRSVVYESRNKNREGEEIWESSTLTPIFAGDGTLKKLVIIDTDISKRKKAEEILSLRNKDITDSINYARRIQGALLIPESEIQKNFTDAFVLFKPKDIVSGDFYWFAESKENRLLAVADCTGHGVPGGFMSMLGFAMLQENMMLDEVRTTADGLSALDKKITDTLNRNDRTHRDGMDMVLCAFSKEASRLQFSCANRPLIRVRKGLVQEFKADKFPIGGGIDNTEKKFQSIEIDLEKGDVFYLFTDGYADQFGGEKQKKFMYKKLVELLQSISHLPLRQQKENLEQAFENWKGKLDQLDDVLVIGIQI